jgi:hypothetical protein
MEKDMLCPNIAKQSLGQDSFYRKINLPVWLMPAKNRPLIHKPVLISVLLATNASLMLQ